MTDPTNPKTNVLPSELREVELAAAINKSGYPLQAVAAQKLRRRMNAPARSGHVQDEWAYVDSDTTQLRSIDLLADFELYDRPLDGGQSRVRPHLDLVIECKRSDSPYVFFLLPAILESPHFPVCTGLFHDEIELITNDDPSTYTFRFIQLLSLRKHPFLTTAPCATTFSKCVRHGKTWELSGSDPFQSLVLPLTKAMRHFQIATRPASTFAYFDFHLTLGVALLDAPMVGIAVEGDTSLRLMPWIRVFRHEYQESDTWHDREKLYAVDVVHKDFFDDYLDQHAMPFAEEFGRLALKHHQILASGKGFARDLGRDWFPADIETRIQVRGPISKVRRGGMVAKNVAQLLNFLKWRRS